MDLMELLAKENLQYEMLQKSLKHLGLDISIISDISEDNSPELLDLLKKSMLFSGTTKRSEKMILRSNIEKILRPKNNPKIVLTNRQSGQPINDVNFTSQGGETPSESFERNRKKQGHLSRKKDKSFGIIKYLAIDKSHAYILPFQDINELTYSTFFEQKGYYANNNEIDSEIEKGQLVYFLKVDSYERLSAHNIDIYFPAFIANNTASNYSSAIFLLDDSLLSEFILAKKIETGFYIVCLGYKSNLNKWEVLSRSLIEDESDVLTKFSNRLYSFLLHKNFEFPHDLLFLKNKLKDSLNFDDLNIAFSSCLDSIENAELIIQRYKLEQLFQLGLPDYLIPARAKSYSTISFNLWWAAKIDKLPIIKSLDDIRIFRSIISIFKTKELIEIIFRLEDEDERLVLATYKQLLENKIEINSADDFRVVNSLLTVFKSEYPEIVLTASNFLANENLYLLAFYKEGILQNIPDEIIIEHVNNLGSLALKAEFIESLPNYQIQKFYKLFPELKGNLHSYIIHFIDKEVLNIPYICFDIESDGNKISEYSWITNSSSKNNLDFDSFETGIQELIEELNSGKIIIGHNIKNFDLPILNEIGVIISENSIWDTYEIEMLLHPCRYSFALKTEHNAIFDSNHGLQLFKTQLFLVTTMNMETINWSLFLPSLITEHIQRIKVNEIWNNIDTSIFEKQSDSFFRPEPSFKNIPSKTLDTLTELLSQSQTSLLIAPTFIWDSLSRNFNIGFSEVNNVFDKIFSVVKVKDGLKENEFLKQVLLRYIQIHEERNTIPYYHLLPNAIKFLISNEIGNQVCEPYILSTQSDKSSTLCICPEDTDQIKKITTQQPDIKIFILGKELYALTSKAQLGNDFDFATIFDRLKNEPIWLQMSGGKNYISIEQRQCVLLGINDFPEYLNNIWLEKIGKGKFKIWCNLNFDIFISHLQNPNVQYIAWSNEEFSKKNAFVVRPDFKKSGYIADQKRVNPESLFRKLYWIYQFKILENLAPDSNKPKILIVSDEIEIFDLNSYARQLGYFVPDTNTAIARQVELLHKHSAKKKLLIAPLHLIDKIIYSNYINAIDFIWDSFLLYEKNQMLKGYVLNNESISSFNELDDVRETLDTKEGNVDLFKLIKHHQPLIDYYYNIITNNNPDSDLFLCDTRFTDYHGIEANLGVKNHNVQLWKNKKEYDADNEMASHFFKSIHENAAVDFDIDEAKEILRQIFLSSSDSDVVYDWYDYQHLCLNDILPANKDLLISLPTGAGKSLLFQGPALFRSAFTNKLSIVISPLRALMQDQVDALWNKGFYNNVEFLSADKSQFEIRDIYRRVSGGEIALLYITPERFRSRAFENALLTRIDADNGLEFVVFDEAHCISQWGQEFRPDYLNAARKIADLSNQPSYHMRKLHFSATISEQVYDEICTIMPGIELVQGAEKTYNPVRDHILIEFDDKVKDEERLQKIAEYLKVGKFNPDLSRAIIFVKSRRKTEECVILMPDYLKDVFGSTCNFHEKVGGFHAGMDAEDRKETYEKFKGGDIVILFATKAFGMGMDIPNIHYLAHYSPPGTFEDFLQEIGRAGRNDANRKLAGFDNKLNRIKTLCLTANSDFAKLKDQLQESRISWHEVKEIKESIEKYVSNFKNLIPDDEIPVAVPFDLYSKLKSKTDDKLDNKFRIALHWLERLERIKLGYFTITHLEFDVEPFKLLADRLQNIDDANLKKTCKILSGLVDSSLLQNSVIQISIATLRSATRLSLEQLFISLIKAHNAGLIILLQEVVIEPTRIRAIEINYGKDRRYESDKYLALKSVFSFARSILESFPNSSSRTFDGDDLDQMLNKVLYENFNFKELPWSQKENADLRLKEYQKYIKDIRTKRSRHAFTIIRLLGKTKHDTKMEKVSDSKQKILVRHTVFNGFQKSDEWLNKINQLEKDSIKLLDYVAKQYFEKNITTFNWAKLINELALEHKIQYLSDLFFVLSVLGYVRTGGLLPSGIEVFISSLDKINEADLQSIDKKIYDEFEQTRKLRELKLIALQVFSSLDKDKTDSLSYDTFIKKYFACNSLENLLKLIEEELPSGSPILKAFRAEAIKTEEDSLNKKQRIVYDSEVNQHINVIAGPGSGKTHTLTLRVARLVHHIGINPEEILVLAYNRAVVSELKERLSTLFHNLGYDSIVRRLKIFTFHGLAKKYCPGQVKDQPFDEWEGILFNKLAHSPGTIMNQLGNIKYILVDEFQDINNVRISLLSTLNKLTNAYIFIIGDPNQSIYGFERLKEGGSLSPFPYYQHFKKLFQPKIYNLFDNHRSYPDILKAAGSLLSLPEELKHLLPIPTRIPDANFIENYVQIIDTSTIGYIKWWDQISPVLQERINYKPYRQIAILFRTNNEVYKGFQKVKGLNLSNVRIRIQGSLPYEFIRIRECFAVVDALRKKTGNTLPVNFKDQIRSLITQLISNNPTWNHFYLRVMHALILDFFEDYEEDMTYDNLLVYITELTYRDDGQLYKIYEKHRRFVSSDNPETEIVLTTMHKVKGLEFDVVIIPPSFSNLPLGKIDGLSLKEINENIDEEKRLAFVAYSRARFRLIVYKYHREKALDNSRVYTFPEITNQALGIPVKPELQKLKIGWAAKPYNFNNRHVNEYISNSVRSGDLIVIKKKLVPNNGNPFVVTEIYKENNNIAIGELANGITFMNDYEELTGFVVNEIVVWSFSDTCKSDIEHGTTYANDWCPEARSKGYIYLVDFAGYGSPIQNE